MDKLGKKLKKHFTNKRNIFFWVLGIMVIITIGFLTSIYVYDKPEFVAEEVRGKIQEGIVDSVAEPIKSVNLALGEKIESWSYQNRCENQENVQEANQYRERYREEEIRNWPTYTDEETGISFKYPEGWEVVDLDGFNSSFIASTDVEQVLNLKEASIDTDVPYWGGSVINLNILPRINEMNTYVDNYLGTDGVTKSSNTDGSIFVVDKGPDRFGGGTGYYYYFQDDQNIYEISLDFFMNQVEDEGMRLVLQQMASTFSYE